MNEHVIVWDLETVPDLAAVARCMGLTETEQDAARVALGDKFPKHIFHSIVCIGALVASRSDGIWNVTALGAPHIGQRPERDLLTNFISRITELRPRLVTFNGNSFDLPVLRYRAMYHRISAPGLTCRPYFNRYTEDAVDLCDVLASFGQARATLHEISRTFGFAGKASGIDGSNVEQLVREGRLQAIADYCQEDVVNTYRIWLLYELFCGHLTDKEYQQSDLNLANRLSGRGTTST